MISERKIRKHYNKLRPIYSALGLPIAGDVAALRYISKAERTLHRHAELACSEPLTETQERNQERYADRVLEELKAMLPKVANYLFVNRDPRGYAIKINPYREDGMTPIPHVRKLIDDSRICRDWGGYGILDPAANVGDE